MQDEGKPQLEPALPFAPQPKGLAFFLGTWSGRILLVNTVVFLIMSWQSGSLVMPDSDVLMRFGAKDPVLLAQGQWWRFITPIFVHIGLIHFAFNTWALYVVAWQLEYMLRGRWFLVLYLLSGLLGNIASAVFSTAVSAGASSSLFGILGSGFFVERIVTKKFEQNTGRRVRGGAYTSMVVGNLVLGFLIPQIDNAAHVGGLISGILFTWALLSLVPNRLMTRRLKVGVPILVLIGLLGAAGAVLGSSPAFLRERLERRVAEATKPIEKFHLYTDALRLSPEDPHLHWERAKILIMYGYPEEAAEDLLIASQDPGIRHELEVLHEGMVREGRVKEAAALAPFVTEGLH